MVSLNADAVIQLLNVCCQISQDKKTFDFDDPTSLDERAYYSITGLEKGIFLRGAMTENVCYCTFDH